MITQPTNPIADVLAALDEYTSGSNPDLIPVVRALAALRASGPMREWSGLREAVRAGVWGDAKGDFSCDTDAAIDAIEAAILGRRT